jgi:hypothetical protein
VKRDTKTPDQQGYGIFYEISDRCVIRYNTLIGNGPDASAPDLVGFYVGGQIGVAALPQLRSARELSHGSEWNWDAPATPH